MRIVESHLNINDPYVYPYLDVGEAEGALAHVVVLVDRVVDGQTVGRVVLQHQELYIDFT